MHLYNRVNKEELKERLHNESFRRKTISFYRYVVFDDPQGFRDEIYREWFGMQCFGRIYVAKEGINAQMSIPEHYIERFLENLESHRELKGMPIKWAVEDDGKSFYKLTIKVRPKIVADGLDDDTFDVTNVGKHLEAIEFHELLDDPNSVVIDMRNHYESEVGHFEGAICPDVDTFREELDVIVEELKSQKDKKLLMYCTGGVRCEKASAWMKHNGFEDVNQLHGGIIEYARKINELGIQSKFKGKNFVFDERLGESINGEIIARCHQCGQPADTHINCANSDCHLLFIQCESCSEKYEACCSDECKEVIHLPEDIQVLKRRELQNKYSDSKIFRSRLRPSLKGLMQEGT